MTVLLTRCPFCESNFMLLNTDLSEGNCVVCGKKDKFSKADIESAESRRDKLAETYLPRLEKAYGDSDYAAMGSIAEEVANAGLSSWYAWFCVGWYDLHEGRTGPAFDDLKLAALFLDEENFDEFYELAMDAVLTSLEEAARDDKDWSDEDTSMVDFTGTLFERFEHLCENGDFMCDLMLRISTISDSITTAGMGGALIKEVMMIVMDYMSGNTYVIDHQALLNNAKAAVLAIDAEMQTRAQDGSMAPNTVKIWGTGFAQFLDMMISYGDRMVEDYSEDELLTLCDYWGVNDYDSVFELFQTAFEYHLGFMLSNGRNKGIQKKRDKALQDYEEAFSRPLVEGLTSDEEGSGQEYDRICPDCGKYLNADENGLLICECGFKSRMVTEDIEDLPENVPELIIMGRKAYQDRDSKMLNNIGERILEFAEDDWHGFVFLAASCVLDQEAGQAVMLFSQAAEKIAEGDREEFRDYIVEELSTVFTTVDDPMQQLSAVFLPSLYESLDSSPAKDCDIPMSIIRRMAEATYDNPSRAFMASMVINPTLTFGLLHSTSLNRQKELASQLLDLADAIYEGIRAVKKDTSGTKDEVENSISTYRDLLRYMIAGIEDRSKGMNDERIGYLSGYWSANTDAYEGLVSGLLDAFFEEGEHYSPKSKSIMKSKHTIDSYLDSYLKI